MSTTNVDGVSTLPDEKPLVKVEHVNRDPDLDLGPHELPRSHSKGKWPASSKQTTLCISAE